MSIIDTLFAVSMLTKGNSEKESKQKNDNLKKVTGLKLMSNGNKGDDLIGIGLLTDNDIAVKTGLMEKLF